MAVVLACGPLMTATTASGYVRYQTQAGKPYAWKTACVWLTAFPNAVSNLTLDQTRDAMAGGLAAWSKQEPALATCSYLDLKVVVAGNGIEKPPARNDGVNSVGFLRDVWCSHLPSGECYDNAALALTTTFARTSTGEIVDADIEVNAVDFVWADWASAVPPVGAQDLQSAITHEVGHLVGLDHTCYLGTTPNRPMDQNGTPLPDCSSAPPDVRETTMFPEGALIDTSKRTLAPDDRQGVCDAYPLAADPMVCSPFENTDGGADAADAMPDGEAVPEDAESTDATVDREPGMDAVPSDAGDDSRSNHQAPGTGCGCGLGGSISDTRASPIFAGLLIAWLVLRRSRPSLRARLANRDGAKRAVQTASFRFRDLVLRDFW